MAPCIPTLAIAAAAFLVGNTGVVEAASVRKAVAVIFPSELGKGRGLSISGRVIFTQTIDSEVEADIQITGLIANGIHGLHVHQSGDSTDTLTMNTLGVHFMPLCTETPVGALNFDSAIGGITRQISSSCQDDQIHGYPPAIQRQPGDMGNITVNDVGLVQETKILGQGKMSLTDPLRSIVGRAVVIHEKRDDGSPEGGGNAGGPLAYGIIGIAAVSDNDNNIAVTASQPVSESAVCEFQTFDENKDKVIGSIRMTRHALAGGNKITVKGTVSGMKAGQHSFHFHEHGDMSSEGTAALATNPVYKVNALPFDKITVASALAPTEVNMIFDTTTDDFRDLIGRSLTIHDGPSTSDPTVARAVCGMTADANLYDGADGAAASVSVTGSVAMFALVALTQLL